MKIKLSSTSDKVERRGVTALVSPRSTKTRLSATVPRVTEDRATETSASRSSRDPTQLPDCFNPLTPAYENANQTQFKNRTQTPFHQQFKPCVMQTQFWLCHANKPICLRYNAPLN